MKIYPIRSCGKRHQWCKICRPELTHGNNGNGRQNCLLPKDYAKITAKATATKIMRGSMVGSKNPNYRGGPGSGYQAGWKIVRRLIWERDKNCRACDLPPSTNRRLDIHHVIPRRDGGTNDPENLVGLHHSCHMKVEVGKMSIITSSGTNLICPGPAPKSSNGMHVDTAHHCKLCNHHHCRQCRKCIRCGRSEYVKSKERLKQIRATSN